VHTCSHTHTPTHTHTHTLEKIHTRPGMLVEFSAGRASKGAVVEG